MSNPVTLDALDANVEVVPNAERGGLNLTMGSASASADVAAQLRVSPVWSVAGWRLKFARLPPQASVNLNLSAGQVYVKVVEGSLDVPSAGAFPPPGAFASTLITQPGILAGGDGALICVFTETPQVGGNIRAMGELRFQGPGSEALRWQSFEERFGSFTDFFDGQDAHMVYGFHLLDDDGSEICYLHFWTAGKGVNLSTHNHGQAPSPRAPAFAEVHWVLNNGTGKGGMYRCDSPESETREHWPMARGEEHGPFFEFDAATGRPQLRDNGAVAYPWHGWQAGSDELPGQAYDFVAAFEISPDHVRI
jgi:hypothetical protein